jgi:hypothetical protein
MSADFEKLTTSVAAGSMVALAVFFVCDGLVPGFRGTVKEYAGMNSFGVIAAIPILTLLYVIGSIVSVLSDAVFKSFYPDRYKLDFDILEAIASKSSDVVSAEYQELRRQKRVSESCVGPLFLLGIGTLFEMSNLTSLRTLVIVTGLGLIGLALISPLINTFIQDKLCQLAGIERMTGIGE